MHNNDNFNGWAILGAGAVGCLWATKLYREEISVSLLLKNDYDLAQYETAGGITLAGTEETLFKIPAVSIDSSQSVISHLLVCTKSHQTIDAINSTINLIDENTIIVLLQNGMGIAEQLINLLPNNPLLLASTTGGANVSKPFTVNAAGDGKTILGAYRQSQHALCPQIVSLLPLQPSPVIVSNNIYSQLWLKLAVNCIINPLTAVNNCANGELLKRDDIIAKTGLLAKEISLVANACGQNIEEKIILNTVSEVAKETADNISSMLQDVRANRKTEIDFINGYLERQAKLHGIKTPVNNSLIRQVQTLYK
ncbi:MAG: 2-dehydropantoate 2-reductase [Porticoccus sp.]|jgi:2-dehydropantoate 2-reductase